MIINKLDFHIDTKLREKNSESDTNFYYKLDIPQEYINKITHVSLLYFTCPKSAYVVEANNNRNLFLLWKEGIGYINIYITEGNYTNTNTYGDTYDIKKELKTQLDNATGNVWTISKYLHPNVETGKFLFECDDATNKKFDFSTTTNNINEIMGFSNITSETEIFTNSIVSTTICNLNKDNVIYITSDICVQDNKELNLNSNSILDVIYISQNKLLSFITETHDIINNMKLFSKKKNGIYHFKLFDEKGLIIELNNISLSFTLTLFTYVDVYNIINKISNYIDYKLLQDIKN
jgi:hypothetical protein